MKKVERIMQGENFTLEDIIAGAAKENQIHLQEMNGFEQFFFKIGFNEGIRFAKAVLDEIRTEQQ